MAGVIDLASPADKEEFVLDVDPCLPGEGVGSPETFRPSPIR